MKKLSLLIFAAAVHFSCEKSATAPVAGTETTGAAATEPADSSVSAPEVNSKIQVQEAQVSPTAAARSEKPALNPPHGEPYHRCDIQVGAPIDSPAPAQNPAPPMVQQQTPNSFNTNPISPSVNAPAASAQNIGPKPALNPAHGEPYHRCDLQVGAPLI